MSFRVRMFVMFVLAVMLPIAGLTLVIRDQMTQRFTHEYEQRVASLVSEIELELGDTSKRVASSLEQVSAALARDNRFLKAIAEDADRAYLIDAAGRAMPLTALNMLQLQDETARIISSGHFRNEFDRIDIGAHTMAVRPQEAIVLTARAPDGPFAVLARVRRVEFSGKSFTLIGGIKLTGEFISNLTASPDVSVSISYPGGIVSSDTGAGENARANQTDAITDERSFPFLDLTNGKWAVAKLTVSHDVAGLYELRQSIDRWFMVASAIALALGILLVMWFASHVSRPLAELAEKTAHLDLDRLDVEFDDNRGDEVGKLAQLLNAMTARLRASAVSIKDAERRATLGDVARQVNHDIKNGLTPIRNVMRHLSDVSDSDPSSLSQVFNERKPSLDSSMKYLEALAGNYAKLAIREQRQPVNVSEIAGRVVAEVRNTRNVDVDISHDSNAIVQGDELSMRRILENVIGNSADSLRHGMGGGKGRVTVAVKRTESRVVITISDTGVGIAEADMANVFDDFFTTRAKGTGLGLSVVRRLVMDMDGSIDLTSVVGEGSTFTIDLPASP